LKKVLRGRLEYLGHKVRPESLDLRDHKVRLGLMVLVVEVQFQVWLEKMVSRVRRDPRVHRDLKDFKELTEFLVLLARLD